MPRKLTELRPCDSCNGPLHMTFYVLRYSIAVVSQNAVNEYLGMRQFFQGRASDRLVENFAPAMSEGFTIAMDEKEFKTLGVEAFLCHTCYLDKELDLAMLAERINTRQKERDERAKADVV